MKPFAMGFVRRTALIGAAVLVSAVHAGPEDPPEGRRFGRHWRMHDPQEIRDHLERLIEQGASEDDPRVQKLRRVLARMERHEPGEGKDREWSRRHGPGRGGRHRSLEEIDQFIQQNDRLRPLLRSNPDGTTASDDQYRRRLRRTSRQISEIMSAFERGQNARAELMISGAEIQYKIWQVLREYRRLDEGARQRAALREQLTELLARRIAIELDVEEMKLRSLRERLEEQEQRLARDRTRQDEMVARKLEMLLSGRKGRHHDRASEPRNTGD